MAGEDAFKSRVLLRRGGVEEYLVEGDGWSSDRFHARDFGSIWAAEVFAEEHRLAEVVVVMAFPDSQNDVVLRAGLPVREK